jgi:xanthine/uracil permease
VFDGKKTLVFWIGLLVLCAASLFLYSVFWTLFFYPSLYYMFSMSAIPVVVGGIFLILIGLILMKSGVRKMKSSTVF